MKKLIQFFIIAIIFGCIFIYKNDIINFLTDASVKLEKREIEIPEVNEYKLNYDSIEEMHN